MRSIKIPTFFLATTLMFWAWQTGLWLFALPMVLTLVASIFIHWRWHLSADNFKQIVKLSLFLLLVLLIYIFIANRSVYWIFIVFQWLPPICFPLLIAQIYSLNNSCDARALFFLQERKQSVLIDLTYPYFVICLIAASAANVRGIFFYLGMFSLFTIALWLMRSSRFSPWLWIGLMIIAASMGIGGHIALHRFQATLEQNTLEWLSNLYEQNTDADPLKRTTALNDIGSVKLSNQILFRAKIDRGQPIPKLLRRATYNKYLSPIWVADDAQFISVQKQTNSDNWSLGEAKINSYKLTISEYLDRNKELLNLPDGTWQIDGLPVDKMERNQYGSVTIEGKPNFLSYRIHYHRDSTIDSPPTVQDLEIPKSEKKAIGTIVDRLNLENKSPQEILKEVETFFQQKFQYSLALVQAKNNATPLSTFLLEHRAGHCEYFATATTLILRAAGIPTRYAIGYSLHEFSFLENQFIVRSRHAHAWTLVYINGAWQTFDTTPASWFGIDNNTASSSWLFILDFFSWCSFHLSLWFKQIKNLLNSNYSWYLLIPLVFILMRRLHPQQQIWRLQSSKIAPLKEEVVSVTGDSEFYAIEQALNEAGFMRERGETLKNWLERLEKNLSRADLFEELQLVIELHYRYRFDPQTMTNDERNKLKSASLSWLEKFKHSNSI